MKPGQAAISLLLLCCVVAGSAAAQAVEARDLAVSSRPDSALPYWSDTGHFRVHYTLTGDDAILGAPDTAYVDSLSLCLERAYSCLHDTLGLPAPLPDGTLGGGSNLIDFYVKYFEPLYIGALSPDTCTVGDGPCGFQCMGHAYVRRNLGSRWRRSTTALEYFQLVQWTTNLAADYWFAASTAVWAERLVFPRDSNYDYWLYEWFSTPYLSLWDDADGFRRLGCAHYWAFLEETQGRSFVPELWMRCCGHDWLTPLEDMLRERGTSFDESLVRFALWCSATGRRADGRHFLDARSYPLVLCQAVHSLYPVEGASVPADSLARPAGSNFVRFLGPGTRDTLRVDFHGDPGMLERRVSLVVTKAGEDQVETTLSPDPDGNATFTVPGWSSCQDATLIVTNFHDAQGNLGFTYSAHEVGALAPISVTHLACTPNPFANTTQVEFETRGPYGPTSVDIFNAGGQRVRTIPVDPPVQGGKTAVWDGTGDDGYAVPFGCYFVRARYGAAAAETKVVYVH
jgi:hypothetical protein